MGIREFFFVEPKREPRDWNQEFSAAILALREKKYESFLDLLAGFDRSCSNEFELKNLYGVGSAPGSPGGIAGILDRAIPNNINLFFALELLNIIEKRVGTGIYLCEVWFSLYQVSLDNGDYEISKEAYQRCINSQKPSSSPRISKELLLETLYKKIEQAPYPSAKISDLNHLKNILLYDVKI
jgi:hypothetical protein